MIHMFLYLEPRYLREEPYVPAVNQVPESLFRNFGLNMSHECRIHISPSAGSYIGGEITAGLLCTPMLRDTGQIFLFIDAGTNGELVVGNKGWLMTCASSAGPAFEGWGIKCGIPASEGSIEKIEIKADGELFYQTITVPDHKPCVAQAWLTFWLIYSSMAISIAMENLMKEEVPREW